MARPMKLDDWHYEAAQYMARNGSSLKETVTELRKELTSEECHLLLRRATFQKILWEARHRYFTELGRDPSYSKDAAIGKLIDLSQKLEESGEFDKAAEVVLKVAKIQGWVGPESTVSVFGELSQRDLDAIREKVAPKQKVQ